MKTVRHLTKSYKELNRVEEYSNWNKNTPEGINNRLDATEDWINGLEDRILEISQVEQNQKKKNKNQKTILNEIV